MKGNVTLYLGIAAVIAVIVGVVWCFQSGPCSGNTGSPDGAPASLGAAISGAISSVAGLATSSGNDLENEDNGIIFGGGA